VFSMLERTREINRLLQQSETVEYDTMAHALGRVTSANIYIVNRNGALVGCSVQEESKCEMMVTVKELKQLPDNYIDELLRINTTTTNFHWITGQCAFGDKRMCVCENTATTIVPVCSGGERSASLIVVNFQQEFTDDDLILMEYCATFIGLAMLRHYDEHKVNETRQKAMVKVALRKLSCSEIDAAFHIFEELPGGTGVVIASKLADRIGVARATFGNALRKFESAGVITFQSLGMKGTYIKVCNEYLMEELKKWKI